MKNNNNTVIVIIVLVVLALLGYWYMSNQGAKTTDSSNTLPTYEKTPVTPPAAVPVTLDLVAQNASGLSGTVILTENIGKVIVELKTSGGDAALTSISEPAHIHSGTCANIGAVKYPLANVTANHSVTVVSASLDKLKAELPLAVNIHKSATDVGTYIACVDLKF